MTEKWGNGGRVYKVEFLPAEPKPQPIETGDRAYLMGLWKQHPAIMKAHIAAARQVWRP